MSDQKQERFDGFAQPLGRSTLFPPPPPIPMPSGVAPAKPSPAASAASSNTPQRPQSGGASAEG